MPSHVDDPMAPFFVSIRAAERRIYIEALTASAGDRAMASSMLGISTKRFTQRSRTLGGVFAGEPVNEPMPVFSEFNPSTKAAAAYRTKKQAANKAAYAAKKAAKKAAQSTKPDTSTLTESNSTVSSSNSDKSFEEAGDDAENGYVEASTGGVCYVSPDDADDTTDDEPSEDA